ncbi:protein O-linked-mannose beta-1,2-N-acetylglucosaminyltransferase 1-like [Penaeus vannamei]|uniref:protein O-linked-mannose beta-1,2-N-acetylglucosaminyltransferase 1-like n=1 Tax=Penaeus vannamei TaxID=6689 RepID=UPI00387F511A
MGNSSQNIITNLLTIAAFLQDSAGRSNSHRFSLSVKSSGLGSAFNLSCSTQDCQEILQNGHASHVNQALSDADGIAMMVVNEKSGTVLLRKIFKTWNVYTYAQDLVWWLSRVQAGRIVVMTVHRAGTRGVGAALKTLESLGSLLISYAPPRALWVWMFIAGGQTIVETIAPNNEWLRNSFAELYAHAYTEASFRDASSAVISKHNLHSDLCEHEAAMGSFCENHDYRKLSPGKRMFSVPGSNTAHKIGVVVCAGGRLQYLSNTLSKLLANDGILRFNVLVIVGRDPSNDGPNSSVISLLEVLQVKYKIIDIPREVPSVNHGLFQFYRKAWSTGINTFSSLKYIAFLDEDVEVSRDWLYTLSHFAPALDTDPSLWCVSGSAPGHRYVFPDPQIFLRGFRQPGWGYLFSMTEARSMVAKWPASSSVSLLYDNFLYRVMSRGRECIFPALSRSYHYGVGVNTVPEIHQLYFLDQPLHSGERVYLPPVVDLTQNVYERRVKSSLESAIPITRNPCAPGFLNPPSAHESKHFVFYFFMEEPNDSPEWATLAECIGAWPYSTQSHHHGCFEIPQPWGGSVWLVGVPYSRYKYLRPPSVPIWQIKSQQELESATAFSNTLRLPPKVNRTLALAFTDLFIKS